MRSQSLSSRRMEGCIMENDGNSSDDIDGSRGDLSVKEDGNEEEKTLVGSKQATPCAMGDLGGQDSSLKEIMEPGGSGAEQHICPSTTSEAKRRRNGMKSYNNMEEKVEGDWDWDWDQGQGCKRLDVEHVKKAEGWVSMRRCAGSAPAHFDACMAAIMNPLVVNIGFRCLRQRKALFQRKLKPRRAQSN